MRGCSGKLRYDTRAAATQALRNFLRRVGSGEKTAVYHCGHCAGFHLGRDPKNNRRGNIRWDMGAKAKRYWQLVRGEA